MTIKKQKTKSSLVLTGEIRTGFFWKKISNNQRRRVQNSRTTRGRRSAPAKTNVTTKAKSPSALRLRKRGAAKVRIPQTPGRHSPWRTRTRIRWVPRRRVPRRRSATSASAGKLKKERRWQNKKFAN